MGVRRLEKQRPLIMIRSRWLTQCHCVAVVLRLLHGLSHSGLRAVPPPPLAADLSMPAAGLPGNGAGWACGPPGGRWRPGAYVPARGGCSRSLGDLKAQLADWAPANEPASSSPELGVSKPMIRRIVAVLPAP